MEFPKVNNKLAFFGFDQTLVAHRHPVHTGGYFARCLYLLTAPAEEHDGDRPLPCMQWYARKLHDEGYGLYCLTHGASNLNDKLKQGQLAAFYPDTPMTYLTVDLPEHKVGMMQAVAVTECCGPGDVIFVDDDMQTVELALAAGIDAKHLSDIVIMYERRAGADEQRAVIKPEGAGGLPADGAAPQETVRDGQIMGEECGFSDENLGDVYEECRRLAEMNGRGRKEGGTKL